MQRTFRTLFVVVTIFAVAFSVGLCAYTAVCESSMDMHAMSASSGHIDHAHALLLAVVPTLILLGLSIFVFFIASNVTTWPTLTLLWRVVERPPPRRESIYRYFWTSRAPPLLV